jgi:hypothetical protein
MRLIISLADRFDCEFSGPARGGHRDTVPYLAAGSAAIDELDSFVEPN